MTTKKKATKIIIILILLVFLVITGLSAIVPYLGGNKNATGTGDILSGDISSGNTISTGVDAMGL